MSLRDHYAFKHTAKHDEYDGTYEICVESVNDFSNNQTFIELIIRENYDPGMYLDPESDVPPSRS